MSDPAPTSVQPTPHPDHHREVTLHASPTRRFVRGTELGLPIFLGYMPAGMAFGILARTLGFSVFAATTCSATALAGAGQFISLSVLGTGAMAPSVLAATTVVNLRYVLFASTLSPYLHGLPMRIQAGLGFTLTDETFAVNVADLRAGLATPASMLGVGAIAWTGWVLGTIIGAVGAGWIGDPSRFGVGFAMPAMFTALFLALSENRRQVAMGLVAAAIALGLPLLARVGVAIPSSWFIIISSMTAATAGAVIWRED
ncbi:MAG: AzlC family ABC transporter permease [Coriobacteriia bacterium]|nr:AzlC family ABC transporter permease [Coriobacteriia bacterium]